MKLKMKLEVVMKRNKSREVKVRMEGLTRSC